MKPDSVYPWAENNTTFTLVDYDGTSYPGTAVRLEPDEEFKTKGVTTQGLPSQFFNYQFEGWSEWFSFVSNLYSVGDVVCVDGTSTITAAEIGEAYGGTWQEIGFLNINKAFKRID